MFRRYDAHLEHLMDSLSVARGYIKYFIYAREVVSGQIMMALILTKKTKKRSSKSDHY